MFWVCDWTFVSPLKTFSVSKSEVQKHPTKVVSTNFGKKKTQTQILASFRNKQDVKLESGL